jgi:glycosyltransferase involved in cell wall biosynthesis
MKVLWVKAGKLLPVDTGGKIRSYNILRHLARNHKVTLLSYYGGQPDPVYESEIARQMPGALCICTKNPERPLARSVDYVFRLLSHAPYAVSQFTHRRVRQTVVEWLSDGRCDVAVCDFLAASLNFPSVLPVPTVLFQHNVETILWRRRARSAPNLGRRFFYLHEAVKMERCEKRALAIFHHVVAVSNRDRDEMVSLGSKCPITVVPTGVDTEKYRVVPSATGDPPLVVFTGSMDWEPNIDGVEYFCREIWPIVLRAIPDARFQIVGRTPHSRVQRLASDSVEVTGTVPSVTDYLRQATVVVVPLRAGGGTRLKIFEAMAMGKAIVSTSIGAEGLDVTHGCNLLLADDSQSFADSILRLLREPSLRRGYEQAAATLASHYDWVQIAERFADVLRGTVARFHARELSSAR